MVLTMSAEGLTVEISSHMHEVYDAGVSKQTITTITEADWQNRPLDPA